VCAGMRRTWFLCWGKATLPAGKETSGPENPSPEQRNKGANLLHQRPLSGNVLGTLNSAGDTRSRDIGTHTHTPGARSRGGVRRSPTLQGSRGVPA
jgi:hypothetical protein